MKYFTYTNIGPRDINEDSFFATIKDGTLYACIADGVRVEWTMEILLVNLQLSYSVKN